MAKEARQGGDAATLEVVMEAAGTLNTWPARRFGGTHWLDSYPSLGSWAKLAIHSYGGSATHGGS